MRTLLSRLRRSIGKVVPSRRRSRFFRPSLEFLEERLLPTFNMPSQTLPTSQQPLDVELGHIASSSSFLDEAILGSDGKVTIALNNGNGYWRSVQTVNLGIGPADGMALTPLGTDAFADLVIQGPNGIYVVKGNGAGGFTLVQTLSPEPAGDLAPSGGGHVQIAAAVLDSSGYVDIVTVSPGTNQVLVYLGNSSGTFSSPEVYAAGVIDPVAVAVGDFIGSSAPDIAIGGQNGSVSFLEGNGDGTFTPRPDLTVTGLGSITGLAVGNFGTGNELAVSSSSGVFLLSNNHAQELAASTILNNGDFNDALDGWTSNGPVVAQPGFAQLQENANGLLTTLQQPFVVPQDPSTLSFNLLSLGLEGPGNGALPDAFEASLLDAHDNSLVPTFAPQATSFFNAQPGGVYSAGAGATINGTEVTLNIAQLTPGTQATLVFDLVGNRPGDGSTATIGNVQVATAPVSEAFTTLALAGPFGSPTGVAFGNLNGAGTLDLAVTDSGLNKLIVYSSNGGVRTDYSLSSYGTGPSALATGALTKDGQQDVAIALAGSNLALSTVALDTTPPQVTAFTPAAGSLLDSDVTQITVQFSEAVQNNGPTGNNSVTNPAAYSLVNLSTGQSVPITSVSYNSSADTATLAVAGGQTALAQGNYQLTVKGANATYGIRDLAGNALGASSAGNSGVDAVSTFTVDRTAPTATLTLTPAVLWSANNQLVNVQAQITAQDPFDPQPIISLVSITANQSLTSP
jgi:Bacterial Ig-like domain